MTELNLEKARKWKDKITRRMNPQALSQGTLQQIALHIAQQKKKVSYLDFVRAMPATDDVGREYEEKRLQKILLFLQKKDLIEVIGKKWDTREIVARPNALRIYESMITDGGNHPK